MRRKIDCNWHKYIDLGLPSGLLWATCNVGANEPWESGLYFSWGNVKGHEKGSWYYFGISNNGPYASTPGAVLTDNIPVDAGYDAARANLGGSWRMPTKEEFKELVENCTNERTTQNGVNGRLFTSRINGNSVFFPSAGYYFGTSLSNDGMYGCYWSSSLNSQTYAYGLFYGYFSGSGDVYPQDYSYRFIGYPVRAVLDNPKDSILIKKLKK